MATHDPAALEFVDHAYFVESGTLHEPDRAELNLWLTEGEAFVTRLHRHGGESLVDQAWAEPPADPWVIAHPEHYGKPRELKHDMERAARQLSSKEVVALVAQEAL